MSEHDQEDRTEQPTAKRLQDAREKGQVPRSRELSNIAVLGAAAVTLLVMAPSIGANARAWLRAALTIDPAILDQPDRLLPHFGVLLLKLMLYVSPIIAVGFAACFIAPMVMGGLRFTTDSVMPKFERMSPMAGMKRMYGSEALAEFGRSLLRVAIVGGVGAMVLKRHMSDFLTMPRMDLADAATNGLWAVAASILAIIAAMGVLALLDVPWQHFSHIRKLRMTKQEIREEYKQQEGSPEVKGHLRNMQRQMASQRMMEAVPTADVLIVNPTHYAVALKYETHSMSAPTVVAKGVDEVALRIREIAAEHKVTLVEAPPLARVLYRQAKVGQEIPVKLYEAVAQVLTYVFQLKRWDPSQGPIPRLGHVEVDESAAR